MPLRKYNRLDDAIRERGGPLGAVFAVDVKPKVAYKHFFSGGGWHDAWQRLTSRVKPERWNWYEIIPEDQPCNLHIDFEFYKRTNPALTPELHTYFLLELCLFLRETFGDFMTTTTTTGAATVTEEENVEYSAVEMEDGDPFELASDNAERVHDTLFDIAKEFPEWRDELSIFQICCVRSRTVQAPEGAKVSFHTIVRVRNFCFRNNYHVGAFMRRFELHLMHKYGGPADNPYFVRPKKSPHVSHKLMPTFDRRTHTLTYTAEQHSLLARVPASERTAGSWENPIDAVIYTKNRNFRMPYNTKALDYRPIFPLNQAARFEAKLDTVREDPAKLQALEAVLWKSMVMRHYSCFRLGSVCYVQPRSQILSCPEPDGTTPMSISNARAYYYLFDPVAHPAQNAYLRKLARRRDGPAYQAKNFLTTKPLMRDDFDAVDEWGRATRFFFHLDEEEANATRKTKNTETNDTSDTDESDDGDDDEEDSADQSVDERRVRYIQQIYTACKRLVPYVAVRHGYPAAVMYSKFGICWDHRSSRVPHGVKGNHPRIHLRTRCHMCDIFPGARNAKTNEKNKSVDQDKDSTEGKASSSSSSRLYTHSGNHVFFDIYYMDGYVVQGCWDGDCRGDKTYGRLFNPTARGRMRLGILERELDADDIPDAVRRAHTLYKESVQKLRQLDHKPTTMMPTVLPPRECSGGGSAEHESVDLSGGDGEDSDVSSSTSNVIRSPPMSLRASSSSSSASSSSSFNTRDAKPRWFGRYKLGKRKALGRSAPSPPIVRQPKTKYSTTTPPSVPRGRLRRSSQSLTFRARTRGRTKSIFK